MKIKRTFHKHLWGSEEWLTNNELYCAKYLIMRKGTMSSLHYHKIKDETFIIIKGQVLLEVGGPLQLGLDKLYPKKKNIVLRVGDAFRLEPRTVHRFRSMSQNAVILEVSTHHDDEDSIKLKVARPLEGSDNKGYTTNKEKK